MPIVRAKKEFVSVSLSLINDSRLSWAARGVMVFIESQPDDYQIDAGKLASDTHHAHSGALNTARVTTDKAIEELIAAGYLSRVAPRGFD